MKKTEQNMARQLRKAGLSIGEISKRCNVAKGSVSAWVRDITLSELQKQKLTENGNSVETIEKRRSTRLANEHERREKVVRSARKYNIEMSNNGLLLVGVSLYWAEGSKTKRGSVEFYNSDPRLMKIMMRFFREVCNVPEEKFRGHLYLHSHLDSKRAENYWSNVTKIPIKQFSKTTQQQNKTSKGKKDSLPQGTFCVGVYSTELFLTMKGWSEKLCTTLDVSYETEASRRGETNYAQKW